MNVASRPAFGFVVEGVGELVTYPGLASRVCQAKGLYCPAVNADGYGGVLDNLHEHLDDLSIFRPMTVLVTLDLRDVLREELFDDCAELVAAVTDSANDWLESRRGVGRFEPLPEQIVVVVQVQQFESWWLADAAALQQHEFLEIAAGQCSWTNVDEEVQNPGSWLKQRLVGHVSLKSRDLALRIIRAADPTRMRAKSRSFDKFCREAIAAYDRWLKGVQEGHPN